MTDRIVLTDAELAEIARAYGDYQQANGTGSVPVEALSTIIPSDLYRRAVDSGYWGAPGTVAGIDYGASRFTGVQGTNDDGTITYTLFVDGVAVASEVGSNTFDTAAFAARHGVTI